MIWNCVILNSIVSNIVHFFIILMTLSISTFSLILLTALSQQLHYGFYTDSSGNPVECIASCPDC